MKEYTSYTTQVSYFGWIAITLTPIALKNANNKTRIALLLLLFAQLGGNLLFIDRGRPVAFFFLFFMGWFLVNVHKMNKKTVLRSLATLPILICGIFIAFGVLIGKSGFDAQSWYGLKTFFGYLTAGLPYLDEVIANEPIRNLSLDHTFASFLRIVHELGWAEAPPTNMLPFYFLPQPTNVGTQLYPFFRDGGVPMVLFGILLITVVADKIALASLRQGGAFCIHFWAFVCFASSQGFFGARFTSFIFLMFAILAIVSYLRRW